MKRINGYNAAKELLVRKPAFGMKPDGSAEENSVESSVRAVLADVYENGDDAVRKYTKQFDGIELTSFEVTEEEVHAAFEKVDSGVISALELAANRIREFHIACKKTANASFIHQGVGRQILPMKRAGIYVPGGTAVYPSTVLMTAVPARVAGVEDVIITTPAQKDGNVPAITLVAAAISNVNRIFKIGGAQAIAAMAFGTQTIPAVDKICGPGNIYVATAKRMVYGTVDIDSIAGPSEVIVVADESASPVYCAADLIAQTEHDSMSSAILITTSSKIADAVEKEMKKQLTKLERRAIISKALDANGVIAVVDTMDEAVDLVNLYAPEHLLLMMQNASSYMHRITATGCMFIGPESPVAIGDYIAGPSHVLPTGGSARFASPLGIEDFMKVISVVAFDEIRLKYFGDAVIRLAEAEGLTAHAQTIKIRLKNLKKN